MPAVDTRYRLMSVDTLNALRTNALEIIKQAQSIGQSHSINGRSQNFVANQVGIEFARIEDGHFDPMKPNDFYFVTTESNKDPKATSPNPSTPTIPRDGGALWRLRFADVANPLKGATLTMLLDGTESPYLNKPEDRKSTRLNSSH